MAEKQEEEAAATETREKAMKILGSVYLFGWCYKYIYYVCCCASFHKANEIEQESRRCENKKEYSLAFIPLSLSLSLFSSI